MTQQKFSNAYFKLISVNDSHITNGWSKNWKLLNFFKSVIVVFPSYFMKGRFGKDRNTLFAVSNTFNYIPEYDDKQLTGIQAEKISATRHYTKQNTTIQFILVRWLLFITKQ